MRGEDGGARCGHTSDGIPLAVDVDRTLPVAAVALQLRTGSVDDPPDMAGLAHVVEHLVYRRLRRDLALHTATLNASTTRDYTRFSVVGHRDTAAPAVAAMAEVVLIGPEALAEELSFWLADERAVIAEERRGRGCRRGRGEDERLFAAYFPPGHPYRHSPIGMPAAEHAPIEAIAGFIAAGYTPGRAHLAVVGDIDQVPLVDGYPKTTPPDGSLRRRRVPLVANRTAHSAVADDGRLVIAGVVPPSGKAGFDAVCLAATLLAERPAVLGLLDHPSLVVWSTLADATAIHRLLSSVDDAGNPDLLPARCAQARARLKMLDMASLLPVHGRAVRLVHAGAALGDPLRSLRRTEDYDRVTDEEIAAALADLRDRLLLAAHT